MDEGKKSFSSLTKGDIKSLFIISLSFMAINLAWSVYNSIVPIFLDNFTASTALIGFIMTFDNIFGLVLQPFFGKLSDKTKSRFGRRTPFLMVGVPVAAVAVVAIPFAKNIGLAQMAEEGKLNGIIYALPMMAAIIVMNFAMSVYRAPTVALMPDMIPAHKRSEANGIVNLFGGLGSVLAFLVGGFLFDINEYFPFYVVAVGMTATLFVLITRYREPETPYEADEEESEAEQLKNSSADLFSWKNGPPLFRTNRNLMLLLLSVFFWFCAYNGVETFFTLFAADQYGMSGGDAMISASVLSLSYLLCAFPAGIVGKKIGRKNAMVLGTGFTITACVSVTIISISSLLPLFLFIAGVGVALININSFPSIVQMSGMGEAGKYTGFYYAFSFSANIASPLLFGGIADLFNSNSSLFIYALVMYILALITILMVDKNAIEARTKDADVE